MRQSRILLVADDPDFLKSTGSSLDNLGYLVKTAAGEQALELLAREVFELVLLEHTMETVDGIDVLQQSRNLGPNCPVMIINGRGDSDSIIQALRNGAADYFLKSCSEKELADRVRLCLEAVKPHGLSPSSTRQQNIMINAVEQAIIGMAVVDLNGYIIAINNAFAAMHGYDRETLKGRHLSVFHSPEQMPEVESFNRQIKEKGIFIGEVWHQHRDGHAFPAYMGNAVFRDDQGRPLGIIGTMHDITSQRQQEEARLLRERRRQQIRKTESLNRMAGAVAHRFNNYLSAVLGNLELAGEDMPATSPVKKLLTEAMSAGQHAAGVSRLMLTCLGLNPGTSETNDLARTCREYLPRLINNLPDNINCQFEIAYSALVVEISEEQLKMILEHLVDNAREAIGDGAGEIRVNLTSQTPLEVDPARVVPPDWHPRDRAYACLEVVDNGCGINEEQFDQLFDPFFSEKFTGRGLGLSVVLGVARGCGGAVTVDSRPGEGSHFQVWLPLVPEAVPAETAPLSTERGFDRQRTVLLVEDEPVVRFVSREMLEKLGLTVHVASDGRQALDLFRQHRGAIGAVFCDVAMPGLDGWETLSELRAMEPELAVIMISGYEESWVMSGEHEQLPQAFIKKPFEMADLKSALEKVWGVSLDD